MSQLPFFEQLTSGGTTSEYLAEFVEQLMQAMMSAEACVAMLEAQAHPEMPEETRALEHFGDDLAGWITVSTSVLLQRIWPVLGRDEKMLLFERQPTLTAAYGLELD